MSIAILRSDTGCKYALHFSFEPQTKEEMTEFCAKRWPRADIVYRFNIFDLKGGSRSFSGWYAAIQDVANNLDYGSDGWITSDFITITLAVAEVFSGSHRPRNPKPVAKAPAPASKKEKKPKVTKAAGSAPVAAVPQLTSEQLAVITAAVMAAQNATKPAPAPVAKQPKKKVHKPAQSPVQASSQSSNEAPAEAPTVPTAEAIKEASLPAGTNWDQVTEDEKQESQDLAAQPQQPVAV